MGYADLETFSELEGYAHPQYIANNFERLDLLSEVEKDVVGGTVSVTGSLVVTTNLATVEIVVACFTTTVAIAATHPFVTADIGPNANQITLKTWTSAYAASAVAATVNYIAIGTLIV